METERALLARFIQEWLKKVQGGGIPYYFRQPEAKDLELCGKLHALLEGWTWHKLDDTGECAPAEMKDPSSHPHMPGTACWAGCA